MQTFKHFLGTDYTDYTVLFLDNEEKPVESTPKAILLSLDYNLSTFHPFG